MFKVGIAGAGAIGVDRHLPAFQNAEETRLVGIYDHSPETIESLADEHDIVPAYSLEELCSISDLVSVCTPPWAHRDLSVEALEQGCHVLSEKPIAMTTAEADDIVAAARESEGLFALVNNFLYLRSVRAVQRLVERGKLGQVTKTHAIQLRQFDTDEHSLEWFQRLPGGMFWDESPHMVYLTRAFLGDLSVTAAEATPRDGRKQRHNVRARFEGEGGSTGHLLMDFDAPISEWWFVVTGTGGIAFVDLFRDLLVWFDRESKHSGVRVLWVILRGVAMAAYGTVRSGLRFLRQRLLEGYGVPEAGFSRQVSTVVEALEKGRQPPVPATQGREDLKTIATVARRAGLDSVR